MTRVIVAIVVTVMVVLGIRGWNSHLVAKGDAQGALRVLGEWDLWMTKNGEIAANQRAENERKARAVEAEKQRNAERIALEQAQRETDQRAAADRLAARNRSLLDTIAQLDARIADLSRADVAPTHASIASLAREATTARELLGSCSVRYAAVATDADGLRAQVTGLLDFVAIDQEAPQK